MRKNAKVYTGGCLTSTEPKVLSKRAAGICVPIPGEGCGIRMHPLRLRLAKCLADCRGIGLAGKSLAVQAFERLALGLTQGQMLIAEGLCTRTNHIHEG